MPNSAVTSAAGQPPKPRRTKERPASARQSAAASGDVQVSAVISTYLLTHLHHVLQRAEYAALQEGRQPLAANYAQLRQLLCLEARSLESSGGSDQPGDANPAQAA